MDSYTILSSKLDLRKGSYESSFNGYLEDYIELVEDEKTKSLLSCAFNKNNDFKIITDVRFKVSQESVSNSIIRYKDIYKLKNKAIVVPYVLYDKEKTIIISDEYIYAKAMYYALTEKGADLEESKNTILAISSQDNIEDVLSNIDISKISKLQRQLDKAHFKEFNDGLELAHKLSEEIEASYIENTRNTKQKDKYVSSCVSKWYMLKKFVYVSYMVDKDILKEVHNNDIKKQRAKAKEYADSIKYIPMSKMWEEVRKK